MKNQQDQITPKIECEDLIYAGQDDDISDLFDIALDVIETGRASNLEGIKQWLVAYTYCKDLKETLHPDLFDAVIKHAIQQSNK